MTEGINSRKSRLEMLKTIRIGFGVALAIAAILSVSASLKSPTRRVETNVKMRLRMIAMGQQMFASSCGHGGNAATIEQLAAPPPGASNGFIPETPAREREDYVFQLEPAGAPGPRDCHGQPTATSFLATAVPAVFEQGMVSFTLTGDGQIWYAPSNRAPKPFAPEARRVE